MVVLFLGCVMVLRGGRMLLGNICGGILFCGFGGGIDNIVGRYGI